MKRLRNHLMIAGIILCGIAFSPKMSGAAAMPEEVSEWSISGEEKSLAIPSIACFAASPDGLYLATGLLNGTITIVETITWNEVTRWEYEPEGEEAAPAVRVRAIAFSPNGRYLAYGLSNGIVAIVSTSDWGGGHVFNQADDSGNTVRSIAFSTNSGLLAGGFQHGNIRIWNIDSKEMIKEIDVHQKIVSYVAFSATRFASIWRDGVVKIWDERLSLVEDLKPQSIRLEGRRAIIFSPDSRFLFLSASKGQDKIVIEQYATDNWSLVKELDWGNKDFIQDFAFSADGKLLAAIGMDGFIKIWSGYTQIFNFKLDDAKPKGGISFSPDGKYLAVCAKHSIQIRKLPPASFAKEVSYEGKGPAYTMYAPFLVRVAEKYDRQYPQEEIKGGDQVDFLTWRALIRNNPKAQRDLKKLLKNVPLEAGVDANEEMILGASACLKEFGKERCLASYVGSAVAAGVAGWGSKKLWQESKNAAKALAVAAGVVALEALSHYFYFSPAERKQWRNFKKQRDYREQLAEAFDIFAQRFYEQQIYEPQISKRAGKKRMRTGEAPPPELP